MQILRLLQHAMCLRRRPTLFPILPLEKRRSESCSVMETEMRLYSIESKMCANTISFYFIKGY
jgi:hypothetical protein